MFYIIRYSTGKATSVQAQRVREGCGSQISDIRHIKVVRLSALRTGRLYPQEMFLVLFFVRD